MEKQGLEGDDIIATLVTMERRKDTQTFCPVRGTGTPLQLVSDDSITVLLSGTPFQRPEAYDRSGT